MNAIKTYQNALRLGATSYVVAGGLVENVQTLAGRAADIELILFDLDGGPSNLPTDSEIESLARLAKTHGHTYTVHLPMDIHFVGNVVENRALAKAKLVIERIRTLKPWAYVTHLGAKGIRSTRDSAVLRRWEKGTPWWPS